MVSSECGEGIGFKPCCLIHCQLAMLVPKRTVSTSVPALLLVGAEKIPALLLVGAETRRKGEKEREDWDKAERQK